MHKKLFLLPILLLSPCANNAFFPDRWMSDMMREMEESFGRMHHMMEEAFEHSGNVSTSKSTPKAKPHMKQTDDGVLFTLEQVTKGDINAQFDDNTLNIKHPAFTITITQLKNRYNQPLLSTEMRSEQTIQTEGNAKEDSKENDKKQFLSSSVSSSMETTSITKPIELDNPEVSYDEDAQTLTIFLPHKSGKKIPVVVKRTGETVTS